MKYNISFIYYYKNEKHSKWTFWIISYFQNNVKMKCSVWLSTSPTEYTWTTNWDMNISYCQPFTW